MRALRKSILFSLAPSYTPGCNSLSAVLEQVSGTGVSVSDVRVPAEVPAGARRKISARLAASASASAESALLLRVGEANGFTRTLPVRVKTVAAQVIPRLTPQLLGLGLLAGERRTQAVTVANVGFSTWTDVRVGPPSLPWVRVEGLQTGLGDLGPGANASFTLVFEPPAGMANASYAQNPLVSVSGGGADPAPLNAGLAVTSSRTGTLLFSVASADLPGGSPTGRLAGANLRLASLDVAGMALSAAADANGLARFADVPAGRYSYRAESAGYNAAGGVVSVEPGLVREIPVFLPTTMVTYKWSVTPTSITDRYDIRLDMTFRTDVPAPALVIDPPLITLDMPGAGVAYTQYTITNRGLVSVKDLSVVPDKPGPAMTIESPLPVIPELKAGQSVVVPLKVTLSHASCHGGGVGHKGVYACAAGQIIDVSAPQVRVLAGNTCPTSAGGGGGGGGGAGNWYDYIGPLPKEAAMNTDIVMDTGCGGMCLEGTAAGCGKCQICQAGQCVTDPALENKPCGTAENICRKLVCRSGTCKDEDNSAETNLRVSSGTLSMADCPNRVPKDKSTYNPWDHVNGCGTQDAQIPDIPDIICGYSFTEVCNKHDACYGQCGNHKEGCDIALMTDALADVCANITVPLCVTSCIEAATLYSVGASIAAYFTGAYNGGQSLGCEKCCP